MQIALGPMEGLVDDILRDVLTRVGGVWSPLSNLPSAL
jgi:tRNA-dihydrouridine synthase C